MAERRILVVSASGGHFDVAVACLPAFAGWRVEMATYREPGELNRFSPEPLGISRIHHLSVFSGKADFRMAVSFCLNFLEAFGILFRSRPHVVFSTGAELAIPVVVIARLFFRCRIVHMETAVHPRKVSLTGRIIAPLCHHFFVQWPEAAALSKGRAEYAGRVF
jgi:UDP-N-acetylglucosamine:LPS N-acetylglucosamine transferase